MCDTAVVSLNNPTASHKQRRLSVSLELRDRAASDSSFLGSHHGR